MDLRCIRCNEEDATVRVDLTSDHTFSCDSCEETFDADDVREYLDRLKDWARVLAWVETSPFRCEKPETAAKVA